MDPTLVTAAKSAQSIQSFVSSQVMLNTMSLLIGDVSMEAAKGAIAQSLISSSPQDRINSAITHLETAHEAYTKVHSKGSWITRQVRMRLDWGGVLLALDYDLFVCSLIALCHAAREDRAMTLYWLNVGDETRRKLETIPSFLAIGHEPVVWALNSRNRKTTSLRESTIRPKGDLFRQSSERFSPKFATKHRDSLLMPVEIFLSFKDALTETVSSY